jgi:predicted glycogen debranching enzyme
MKHMMEIDKMRTQDLAYAISREYLVVSRAGAYAAGTIAGCNTRKYHGLLVAPQPQLDDNDHVLLAALDETVNGQEIGVRRYPGEYKPDGHKAVAAFAANPIPRWVLKVGDAVIVKELTMDEQENRVYIRYTLQSPGSVDLELRPFLAFRNMHTTGRANGDANLNVVPVESGIQMRLYRAYDDLFIQTSSTLEFVENGYWYYNVEYAVERERGYEWREDLYSPGYFRHKLVAGQPLVITAGLELKTPDERLVIKPAAHTFKEHLLNAAKQFIIHTPHGIVVRAGYYWFGSWGRDTCIALPGLTLLTGNIPAFTSVIDTLQAGLKDGLLSNRGNGQHAVYNTVDASLWFVWCLQYFATHYSNRTKVWARYKDALKDILNSYRRGTLFGIRMLENGLITQGQDGYALTWMDAVTGDKQVTPRRGLAVEINALWYNAVCFCMECDDEFAAEWEGYPEKIAASFRKVFWDEEKKYLADCENDWSVRPNQIFAVSLPYSPLTENMQKAVVEKVKAELLTPRGLRTLSPLDERYIGVYYGTQAARDDAYHQGTVWPWFFAHFAEACLKAEGATALPLLQRLYEGMAATLEECCFNSIPEVFDGNYPYKAGGAVAQAWSVAELIRMGHLIYKF